MQTFPTSSAAAAERAPVEHTGRAVSNERVAAGYRHLVLDVPVAVPTAHPGQFFQILCPAAGDDAPFLRRPMSVYRSEPGRVEFLFRVAGAGTRGLASVRPGDGVPLLGPLGVGFRLDPAWTHIVIVARGVGLATLAPLVDFAAQSKIAVTALLSARSPVHVMSVARFTAAGAAVTTLLDSDGSSAVANVERMVRRLVAERGVDAVFTCGSNRLLLLLQRIAAECGVPGQVAVEQRMACGLGMCFSCVRAVKSTGGVASKRVCWDGPVFDLHDVYGW